METRLLAGSSLVHLSLKVDELNFHIHARIPGLNFLKLMKGSCRNRSNTNFYL